MKDPKLEKVKDLISILQEEFIDTKFILVSTDEDLERLKLETEMKEQNLFESNELDIDPEDFWSQDGLL